MLLRVDQELLEALDELEAAGEQSPSLRYPLIVSPDLGVSSFCRSPLGIGRARKSIRNVLTKSL